MVIEILFFKTAINICTTRSCCMKNYVRGHFTEFSNPLNLNTSKRSRACRKSLLAVSKPKWPLISGKTQFRTLLRNVMRKHRNFAWIPKITPLLSFRKYIFLYKEYFVVLEIITMTHSVPNSYQFECLTPNLIIILLTCNIPCIISMRSTTWDVGYGSGTWSYITPRIIFRSKA